MKHLWFNTIVGRGFIWQRLDFADAPGLPSVQPGGGKEGASVKTTRSGDFLLTFVFCAIFVSALEDASPAVSARQSTEIIGRRTYRKVDWNPPRVDAPLRSVLLSPRCTLPDVLEQAATRANDLAANLQRFTAQEKVKYQASDHQDNYRGGGEGTFEYLVDIHESSTGLIVQEKRNPVQGSQLSTVMTQDVALPAIALIFLPKMQSDYDMNCEATVEWKRRPAWVIRFQQRKDRQKRTLAFRTGNHVYPGMLRGRAWIAADSGEVVHMELTLMEPIEEMKVREWYLSIGYAPVQFRTRDARVWLPQTADTFYSFVDYRTMVSHTFSDFLLFAVQTEQTIGKPQ